MSPPLKTWTRRTQRFARKPPHTVLLDVQLGLEDGLSLAAWIRKVSDFKTIPVMAVTAHAMVTDQERVIKSRLQCMCIEANRVQSAQTTPQGLSPGNPFRDIGDSDETAALTSGIGNNDR